MLFLPPWAVPISDHGQSALKFIGYALRLSIFLHNISHLHEAAGRGRSTLWDAIDDIQLYTVTLCWIRNVVKAFNWCWDLWGKGQNKLKLSVLNPTLLVLLDIKDYLVAPVLVFALGRASLPLKEWFMTSSFFWTLGFFLNSQWRSWSGSLYLAFGPQVVIIVILGCPENSSSPPSGTTVTYSMWEWKWSLKRI